MNESNRVARSALGQSWNRNGIGGGGGAYLHLWPLIMNHNCMSHHVWSSFFRCLDADELLCANRMRRAADVVKYRTGRRGWSEIVKQRNWLHRSNVRRMKEKNFERSAGHRLRSKLRYNEMAVVVTVTCLQDFPSALCNRMRTFRFILSTSNHCQCAQNINIEEPFAIDIDSVWFSSFLICHAKPYTAVCS